MIISSDRVVVPGGVRPAAIHVHGGRITAIGAIGEPGRDGDRLDAGGYVVMPGLVDTHVHINDPGRSEWEGFTSATRAAAAGGVTTLVDMPLNSVPPTTTVDGLKAKRRAADGRCHVDVGFWGGVVPGNAAALDPLARVGVRGFKCFLAPTGVDEFTHVGDADLRRAAPVLSRLGLPLLVHAELPAALRAPRGPARRYSTWLDSRPPESERAAVAFVIRLSRECGVHVHVVHLSAADSLDALTEARAGGVAVTSETCPHYLTFRAEGIPDGATAFKCAPPIRAQDHRERLWQALTDGTVDLIATDHSPAPAALKHLEAGDFLQAWGGIASLQVGLAAVWTGASERGLAIAQLSEWMSGAPARLAGLEDVKGRIAVGHDADFVIWDPDAETVVDARSLYHRHPVTPYDGMRLRGRVWKTILRGEVVFEEGRCVGEPKGRLLGKGIS